MKKKIISILAIVSLVLGFTGCGSKSKYKAEDNISYMRSAQAFDGVDRVNSDSMMEAEVLSEETFAAAEAYDELAFEDGGYGSESKSQNFDNTEVTVDSQMLIKHKYITVETTDFEALSNNVVTIIQNHGGYVENSSVYGTGNSGDRRTATYVFRVPASAYNDCCALLSENGTIIQMSENTDDVTAEYIDAESRLVALQAEYDTLIGLLEQATDLDTIIILQDELTDVRYQIENYKGTIRYLENQVSYCTINITINEVTHEEETKPVPLERTFSDRIHEAFDNMRSNVKDDFEDFVIDSVENLPATIIGLLIWIVFIVLIIIFIRRLVRKLRASKKSKVEINNDAICNSESDKSSSDSGAENNRKN